MSFQLLENDIASLSGTVRAINSIETGLPTSAIEKIAAYFEISVSDLMIALRISRSTWHRRKRAGKLDFSLSDKVYQLAELIGYGERVFGDEAKVRLWFKTPSVVFEGRQPIQLVSSLSGLNLINEELLRIEHGVYI